MTAGPVVFRLEASNESGLGHLARCSALIRRLVDDRWPVVLASSSESSIDLLQRAGVHVLVLDGGARFSVDITSDDEQVADADALVRALDVAGITPGWIVLDHYGLGAAWERSIRRTGARILVLEDHADRLHDADVIVSDSPGPIDDLACGNALVLRGVEYALLGEEHGAPVPPRDAAPPFATTIVYGSSDPTAETESMLAAIARHPEIELRPLNVVIGPTNERASAIEALAGTIMGVVLQQRPASLAPLLRATDVLFTAGGQVLLEGLAAGCACFVTVTADNQARSTEALLASGVIDLIAGAPGPDVAALDRAILRVPERAPALLDRVGRQPAVDALGPARIVREMARLSAGKVDR